MTTTNIYPGSLQALGLAPESTYGVAAAAPTFTVPCDSVPKWDPKINPIKDNGLRGTMGTEFNVLQGMHYDELSYSAMLFGDSVFPHLVNMLGMPDNVTGTTAAPTTTLSSASVVGATSISVAATIPASTLIQIDTGSNAEIVTTTAVSGAGPYTLTVPALKKAHAASVPVTKVVAPFTHSESLYNGNGDAAQPISYTGFVWMPNGRIKVIPGMMLSDLKFSFKVNDKSTLSATWMGLPATEVAASTIPYTPTALKPMNSSNLSIKFAGVAAPQYASLEIDLKRDTKAVDGATGSTAPIAIFAGALTATGTLDGIFQGTTDAALTDYLANTQPTLTASIYADGDSTHPLSLQMSQIALMSAPPAGSMTSYMSIQSAFDAVNNSTDALDGKLSPIQATLATATSTSF
jgi:hypothetical protein